MDETNTTTNTVVDETEVVVVTADAVAKMESLPVINADGSVNAEPVSAETAALPVIDIATPTPPTEHSNILQNVGISHGEENGSTPVANRRIASNYEVLLSKFIDEFVYTL